MKSLFICLFVLFVNNSLKIYADFLKVFHEVFWDHSFWSHFVFFVWLLILCWRKDLCRFFWRFFGVFWGHFFGSHFVFLFDCKWFGGEKSYANFCFLAKIFRWFYILVWICYGVEFFCMRTSLSSSVIAFGCSIVWVLRSSWTLIGPILFALGVVWDVNFVPDFDKFW